MKRNETAVFGGGCFWCTEAIFKNLKGVITVVPGYAGGNQDNPFYSDVALGQTGHAEVVKIIFDPQAISYSNLVEIFFSIHNPTTPNRQGNDIGTQYRSIILYLSEAQKKTAEKILGEVEKSHQYDFPIITQIKPLKKFYPAENYHKDYYDNHKNEPYCRLVISPKLKYLREKYSEKLSQDKD